jgi:hypothetical protein
MRSLREDASMSRYRTLACALAATSIFLGCATTQISVTRQVFHRFGDVPSATFSILPLQEQEQSLEYYSYRDRVRERLTELGWEEAPVEEAQVLVFLLYYIDDGRPRTVNIPVWGRTGVSSSTTTGTVTSYGGGGTYSGTTTYRPTYGVTGYVPVTQDVYTRRLDVLMFDSAGLRSAKPVPVYEGRAVSQGRTGVLSKIMPYLVDAMFQEFPGENGEVFEAVFWPE